jgi:hypothetical protein
MSSSYTHGCGPDANNPVDILRTLYGDWSGKDISSASDSKDKDALKADYDAGAKSWTEVESTIDAYRKAYPKLKAQFEEIERFVNEQLHPDQGGDQQQHQGKKCDPPQSRLTKEVTPKRQDEIKDRLAKLLDPKTGALAAAECKFHQEEKENQGAVEAYEGAKKAADYQTKLFEELKGELKRAEVRSKAWTENRDSVEKYFAEEKYERAFFWLVVLSHRITSKPPLHPSDYRKDLVGGWLTLHLARRTVSKAKAMAEKAAVELDAAKKAFEQVTKTGLDEAISSLDLDPPKYDTNDDAAAA